jgi:hypothetical protein
MLTGAMNLFDLSINQLKRAATIKEQIEALNRELRNILGGSARAGAAPKKKLTARASGRTLSAKSSTKARKKAFSAATRAKLSAKLKAYWAAKRAGKK